MKSHILFDFFGTLVGYGNPVDYPRTLRLLAELGLVYEQPALIDRWNATWLPFEERCQVDHREFSMVEGGTAFLTSELGRVPTPSEVDTLVEAYVGEWDASVVYHEGIADWIDELSRRYKLAVVSNTHEPKLVPAHLRAMGIDHYFEAVVLSVEVGWRKPHPRIYATALERLGIEAGAAVFVGDTHDADFLGPQEVGMTAYLIDPRSKADIPSDRRLASVLDIAQRLRH